MNDWRMWVDVSKENLRSRNSVAAPTLVAETLQLIKYFRYRKWLVQAYFQKIPYWLNVWLAEYGPCGMIKVIFKIWLSTFNTC